MSSPIKACYADDVQADDPRVQEEEQKEQEDHPLDSVSFKEEEPLHLSCRKEESNRSEDTPNLEAISSRTFGTRS